MRTVICAVLLLGLAVPVVAGDQGIVISGFPLGVGATIDPEFFAPYQEELLALARLLDEEPDARAVLVGMADGARYADDNDAKNPGLSLGRAHALRNVLVNEYGVKPEQILIQSNDVPHRGDAYRAVCVRVEFVREHEAPFVPVVEKQEPVVQPIQITENQNYFYDRMKVRLGIGMSSSPFGALPVATGAIIWNRQIGLEFLLGHSFWDDHYQYQGAQLDTWRRMFAAHITYYPWDDKPVALVGGWSRTEEIAQSQYEYVRLSEGPVLGVNVIPIKHLSISGLYNPSRQRVADSDLSSGKHAQFLLAVTFFADFGGGE